MQLPLCSVSTLKPLWSTLHTAPHSSQEVVFKLHSSCHPLSPCLKFSHIQLPVILRITCKLLTIADKALTTSLISAPTETPQSPTLTLHPLPFSYSVYDTLAFFLRQECAKLIPTSGPFKCCFLFIKNTSPRYLHGWTLLAFEISTKTSPPERPSLVIQSKVSL